MARRRIRGSKGASILSKCKISLKSPRKRTVRSIKKGNVFHNATRRSLLKREHREPSGYD